MLRKRIANFMQHPHSNSSDTERTCMKG